MAYTPNQLIDVFQSSLNRAPTDYELNKFSTASPQTLATLKDTYGKMNTNSSISDYLAYKGTDPSIQSRTALGQQYGIGNIGTAEGNTALLNKLKSGEQPTTTPVQGTITPAVTQEQPQTVVPPTQQDGTVVQPQTDQPQLNGTVKTAADGTQPQTPPPTVETHPAVVQAKTAVDEALKGYQDYQKQVAEIDSTIAQLRSSIAGALKDKEAQAAASGGVVSRAQIAAEVAGQSQGIQKQINDLLTQRAPLATAQSQYSAALQQSRNDLKDAQANFFKEQTLGQGQQKIEQAGAKMDVQQVQFAEKQAQQQQQFTQKLEQSGWKSTKVNQYDEYGNVVGQSNVWTQNPADKTGFNAQGQVVNVSNDPKATPTAINLINNAGGIKWTGADWQVKLGMTDSGIKASDGGTFALPPSIEAGNQAQKQLFTSSTYSGLTLNDALKKWSTNGYGSEIVKGIPATTKVKDLTPAQVDQIMTAQKAREGYGGGGNTDNSSVAIPKVPLNTSSTVDISTPGYSTSFVTFDGKNTQMNQSYIDKIAIQAIVNGGVIPSGAARGTKGLPIVQTNAIKARIGQLDPGGSLQLNKAKAQAWGKTLGKQIDYAVNLDRSLKSADESFQQVLTRFKGTGINDYSMPLANLLDNAKKYNLGSNDVSAFKASLKELGALYAQVFAKSGSVAGVNDKANEIIDGNISLDNLKGVLEQLQTQGKIDVDVANKSIQGVEGQISNIVPGSSRQPTADNTQLFSDAQAKGYQQSDVQSLLDQNYTPEQIQQLISQ